MPIDAVLGNNSLIPHQQIPLSDTPTDVLNIVLRTMKPSEVLTYQLVCKDWKRIFNQNDVWHQLLQKCFPSYQVPNEITNLQNAFKVHYQQQVGSKLACGSCVLYPIHLFSISGWWSELGPIATSGNILYFAVGTKIYFSNLDRKKHSTIEFLLESHDKILHLAISERKLFYCSKPVIFCFDLDERISRYTIAGHDNIRALAASDGKLFYSIGDGQIHVWDYIKSTAIATIDGHGTPVIALAASNGRFVSAGDGVERIKVWDSNTLSCIALHNDEVLTNALAISNGRLIIGTDTGEITASRLDNFTDSDILLYSFMNSDDIPYLAAADGVIIFPDTADPSQFLVMDFNAKLNEVFEQLACIMENCKPGLLNDKVAREADNRFEKMPKEATDQIMDELVEMLNRENPDGLRELYGMRELTSWRNPLQIPGKDYVERRYFEPVYREDSDDPVDKTNKVWRLAPYSQKARAIRNYLQKQTGKNLVKPA